MAVASAVIVGLLYAHAGDRDFYVLRPSDYKCYIDRFNQEDNELYVQHVPNDSSWAFLQENIPFFDCPDKEVMTTYYFRWWTFRKHIKKIPHGFIFTEFLPKVYWSGKYNSIACAAAHHIYEGRWLRDTGYVNAYARFWFSEGNPRMYSFWVSNALWEYYKLRRQNVVLDLFPELVKNYAAWERGWNNGGHFIGRNPDGLFSTYDDRDGMEMQIGGSGKRPSINAYMYGEAKALAEMAGCLGDGNMAKAYNEKAGHLRKLVEGSLWDEEGCFFKTRSERKGTFVDVRELQGYTPWYMNLPEKGKGFEEAWKFMKSDSGFNAPYGLTTAEQSHPRFRLSYEGHECQWNGPVWPFATSVTLTALANVLNNYSQDVVSEKDYFDQFLKYSRSQRRVCEDGRIIPWIDENQNPYTGDWISCTRLASWKDGGWSAEKGGVERGKDYNHSTYCDLLISGLVGIRPQTGDNVVVHPLVPAQAWEWFCLDGVSYQGRVLTVFYDRTGKRYGRGKGFFVLVDGEVRAQAARLQELRVSW